MTVSYQIRNWNESFEFSESRKIKQPARCAHPNSAGKGYLRLTKHPQGAMIYGLFLALCNVNSSRRPEQRIDGWLTDDGTPGGEPWTAEDFELFTGFPAEQFETMLSVLTEPRIGWIIRTTKGQSPTLPGDSSRVAGRLPGDCPGEAPATLPETLPAYRQTDSTDRQRGQTDRQTEDTPLSTSAGGAVANSYQPPTRPTKAGTNGSVADATIFLSGYNAATKQDIAADPKLLYHIQAIIDEGKVNGWTTEDMTLVVGWKRATYSFKPTLQQALKRESIAADIGAAREWARDGKPRR